MDRKYSFSRVNSICGPLMPARNLSVVALLGQASKGSIKAIASVIVEKDRQVIRVC